MKTILRTLRTGGQTAEYVPDWLADMIVAAVTEEENTASLRVIDGHTVPDRAQLPRQDWRELALAMASLTSGGTTH